MPEPIAVPVADRDPQKRYTPEGLEVPAPSANDVLYEVADGIATVTLNRPLVLNAVDWSLTYHFAKAIERAEGDEAARAVIVRGAGRTFCAGGDLQGSKRPEDLEPVNMLDTVLRIWRMPKPVIASVRGHAVGQGIEIAGMCDFTIASEDAQFGEIQIRHGFPPPMLVTPFLLGLKHAKELMMTGDLFDAQTVLRMGLVNRVVPTEQLDEATRSFAARLVSLPPTTVALNKLLVNRVHELAGFIGGMQWRDDPVLDELANATRGDTVSAARLETLRQQGWEAFKQERDQHHRS
jgi:enoyl-CoA hydratase